MPRYSCALNGVTPSDRRDVGTAIELPRKGLPTNGFYSIGKPYRIIKSVNNDRKQLSINNRLYNLNKWTKTKEVVLVSNTQTNTDTLTQH